MKLFLLRFRESTTNLRYRFLCFFLYKRYVLKERRVGGKRTQQSNKKGRAGEWLFNICFKTLE